MRIRKKIELMRDLKQKEIVKPIFFRKMKTNQDKEETFVLTDDNNGGIDTKKRNK